MIVENLGLARSAWKARHRARLNASSQVRFVHLRLPRPCPEQQLAARPWPVFKAALLNSRRAMFEAATEVNAATMDGLETDPGEARVQRSERALGLEVNA